MSVDTIARQLALALYGAPHGTALPIAFVSIVNEEIPSHVTMVSTYGHTVLGKGAADYLDDGTPALAAAHPRFCKQSKDGRYWRLVAFSGWIFPEQGGALGDGITNDQPALYDTVAYANAQGILCVQCLNRSYLVLQPTLQPGSTNWSTAFAIDKNHCITTTKDLWFRGLPGGSIFNCFNKNGGNNNTAVQFAGTDQWRGSFFVARTLTGAEKFNFIGTEDIIVDGNYSYPGSFISGNFPNLSDGIDLTHKGFSIQDRDCDRLYHRRTEMRNFLSEIVYHAGSGVKYTEVTDCHFHGSGQCAFNPGTLSRVVARNSQFGRAYQAAEIIQGEGHEYTNCRFYDSGSVSAMGTMGFVAGYPYFYPNRTANAPPGWLTLNDVTFDYIANLVICKWVKGRITLVDCSIGFLDNGAIGDIDLDITAWCDIRNNNNPVGLSGPPNLTTQVSGAPAGVYHKPPANIRMDIKCRRTEKAVQSNVHWAAPIRFYQGLIDQKSCQFTVSGEATYHFEVFGTPPVGFRLPLVKWDVAQSDTHQFIAYGANPEYQLTGDQLVLIKGAVISFYNPTAGPYTRNITIDVSGTITYAHGQLVRFIYNGPWGITDRIISFAKNGTGMRLNADRTLRREGEYLDLQYDAFINKWIEVGCVSQGV